MQDFPDLNEYYTTFFHELAHSTGHATRLDRVGVAKDAGRFGSETYSKAELVAELTVAFLATEAGLAFNIENTTAYIGGWLKARMTKSS